MVANTYKTYTRKQNRNYVKSNYLVQYKSDLSTHIHTLICHHTTSIALTINPLSRYHTLLYYILHQLFLYRLLRSGCMDTYFTLLSNHKHL